MNTFLQKRRYVYIVTAILFLGIVIPYAFVTSGLATMVIWLPPSSPNQARQEKLFIQFQNKLLNWSSQWLKDCYFQHSQSNMGSLVEGSLLYYPNKVTAPIALGPPSATNGSGMRVWIGSPGSWPPDADDIVKQLKLSAEVCILNRPRFWFPDRLVSIGSVPITYPPSYRWTHHGTIVTYGPYPNVEMLLSPRRINNSFELTLDMHITDCYYRHHGRSSTVVKTNFPGVSVTVTNGGSVLVEYAVQETGNRYWFVCKPKRARLREM